MSYLAYMSMHGAHVGLKITESSTGEHYRHVPTFLGLFRTAGLDLGTSTYYRGGHVGLGTSAASKKEHLNIPRTSR